MVSAVGRRTSLAISTVLFKDTGLTLTNKPNQLPILLPAIWVLHIEDELGHEESVYTRRGSSMTAREYDADLGQGNLPNKRSGTDE